MKQEGRRHAKLIKAARELGIDRCAMRGIVDEIHDETAARYPAGDIGRASNEDIAVYIDYSGDIDHLIEVMLKHKLLDAIPVEQGRLYVHDWHDHCERYVREKLRGKNQTFANGLPPYPKNTEAPKAETQPPTRRPRRPRTPASQAQNAPIPADARNSPQTDAISLVYATLPKPSSPTTPPGGEAVVVEGNETRTFTDDERHRFDWETVEQFLGRTLNHHRDWEPFVEQRRISEQRGFPLGPNFIRELAEEKLAEFEAKRERPRYVTPLIDAMRDAVDEIAGGRLVAR